MQDVNNSGNYVHGREEGYMKILYFLFNFSVNVHCAKKVGPLVKGKKTRNMNMFSCPHQSLC